MEGQLALAKVTLLEQEDKLKELVHEKNKIREQYDRTNNSDNSLKKVLRNKDHDILVLEGDICLLKKRIKRITYKIEIASKMSEIELEDDIADLKVLLSNVGNRLKKNQELVVETFDNMLKMQEKGKELVKDIEASKQKAMDECDIRSDKLMSRLDTRQDYVDKKKAEIREIRRASGIPDPEELAEIRRLAALNQAASSDD